jgi:hypothetical protein
MKTFKITDSQKGNNTKRSYKPTKLVLANREHKGITLSLSAICRYIDKLKTQNLLAQKGFKPNAIESIEKNGAFKTIRPLLNDKEQIKLADKKKFWSLYSLSCIANRLDKK